MTLARGVSRDVAEQLAALAETHQIATVIQPSGHLRFYERVGRWFGSRAWAAFLVTWLPLAAMFSLIEYWSEHVAPGLDRRAVVPLQFNWLRWAIWMAISGFYSVLGAMTMRSEAFRLPLAGAKDPALHRLAEGVRLRAARLRASGAVVPEELVLLARRFAAAPEESRDEAAAQLLQTASALDAALAEPASAQRALAAAVDSLQRNAQEVRAR